MIKRRIFKFELPMEPGNHKIKVPFGSKFLTIQVQDTPVMWMMVDIDAPLIDCDIRCLYTGVESDNSSNYLGTVQIAQMVLHYFTSWYGFTPNTQTT